ncbi:MAG: DUF1553 domain-containing protein [Bryobacteraceae bacterium]
MNVRALLLLLAVFPLSAADLVKIVVEPSAGYIHGTGGVHSFLVTGHYPDGTARDLTRQAAFSLSDAKVANTTAPGVFTATAEGFTEIRVQASGLSAKAALVVGPPRAKSWQFPTDVAPIFSKLGCNSNNCHGALNGQSGFKLSLFGYDPPADHEAIVRGSKGRRINRATPEKSLLLMKPTFQIPHGGGKLFDTKSLEFQTLLHWITDGAPIGEGYSPKLTSITVSPSGLRVLDREGEEQQLLVIGSYADGSRVDLTHRARFETGDEHVVSASPSGLLTAKARGETTILVRTLGQVEAVRIAVTAGRAPVDARAWPRNNFVDDLLFDKLAKLRIRPSELSSDEQFLRRVYLDLMGALPSATEAAAFLESKDPKKRDALIDQLLDRPEYAQFWSLKWGDLFMIQAIYNMNNSPFAAEYFRRNFAEDRPYNDVVNEMLTGVGPLAEVGPNSFYSREDRRPPEEYATLASKTFLGLSLECARCHDHPKEKWKRDDYLGIAAFFSQVRMKERNGYRPFEGFVVLDYAREFRHPQSRQVVKPRLLDGAEPVIGPMADRRELLANWITARENPYFARATVNRVWEQFFGRGLVDPVEDFRATNPPTHPKLLDRLAATFVEYGYRFKPLIALMLKSRAYQLAASTNETNAEDLINYSRYYMRRLGAEQMLDAVSTVTGVPESYLGYYPGKRAIDLPDPGIPSYFLQTFDRSARENATCERNTTPGITQALHMINGETILAKVAHAEGELRKLIAAGRSDEEIIRHFYLTALSRHPKPEELAAGKEFLAAQKQREKGLEGLTWALLNSKEFSFNH